MLRKFFPYIIILAAFALLSACRESAEQKESKNYFDVDSFFRKEVNYLTGIRAFYVKALNSDGQIDNITNKAPDWDKEFQLFFDADINKAAYVGKVDVDTIYDAADSTRKAYTIEYSARDKDLRVQKLSIYFNANGLVDEVTAHLVSHSALNEVSTELQYFSRKHYKIESIETSKVSGTSTYTVQAEVMFEDKYFQ